MGDATRTKLLLYHHQIATTIDLIDRILHWLELFDARSKRGADNAIDLMEPVADRW
ncbi:hypothetical protein [Chamaesiphon sp. VAR_48_metabat_403]|uniref:hypothetical protein n=1 Tax=Chamaesiphon sp. VAR_48_metabat_403 TaxID=2964700 RepID=UPI00286E7D3C|nr:hypothetical protein [Chamaesiphon sp. VAR_48_metabat_403]